jgi:hypothetical protein
VRTWPAGAATWRLDYVELASVAFAPLAAEPPPADEPGGGGLGGAGLPGLGPSPPGVFAVFPRGGRPPRLLAAAQRDAALRHAVATAANRLGLELVGARGWARAAAGAAAPPAAQGCEAHGWAVRGWGQTCSRLES